MTPRRAKTSTERSREFRQRHPGYYQRLHAKKRAFLKAAMAKHRVEFPLKVAAMVQAWRDAVMPPVDISRMLPAPAVETTGQVEESSMPLREFIAIPSVAELAAAGRERVGVVVRQAERLPGPGAFRR